MTLAPLGDSAVAITIDGVDGRSIAVSDLASMLRAAGIDGVTDVVPAYDTVTVFYEPARWAGDGGSPYRKICDAITAVAQLAGRDGSRRDAALSEVARLMEIPVCYGGEGGPDLPAVAAHTGFTEAEVIARHSGAEYRVQAIGFTPGFPYLSGLPAELTIPRKASPRAKVPAGAVGIGGAQTGVYPAESPGGWQLIGETPLHLFDVRRREPALLRVGDRVKFRALGAEEAKRGRAKGGRIADEEKGVGDERADETSGVIPDIHGERRSGLRVVSAGMFTTVQDLGRSGQRAAGVPSGGAMDAMAARLANLLVGNAEDAAVLELTLIGPELEFLGETLIAVGGAEFAGCVSWRPVRVAAGETIKFGAAVKGCRGYLAVAGGIDVPRVLGSRSTYARAGLGGWEGRALRAGDVVPAHAVSRKVAEHWWIDPRALPEYGVAPTVRVVRGGQAGEFGEEWMGVEWTVTLQADRMGMRLAGPALVRRSGRELASSAVAPGTVQVPPNGQPIVLMADAQTIGGYPQLAQVVSADLALLAQLRPGDILRFQEMELEEAHQLVLAREYSLGMLREGLAQKFR